MKKSLKRPIMRHLRTHQGEHASLKLENEVQEKVYFLLLAL